MGCFPALWASRSRASRWTVSPAGTSVVGRSDQRAQGREGPRAVADGALLGLRHLAEGAPVALDGHYQRVVSEAAVAAGRVSDVALDHAAHDVLAAARSSDGCGAEIGRAHV